jgi:hypothetical protein
VANVFYTNGKARIIGGTPASGPAVALITDTIKMILVTSGYTPSASHNTIADLGANEVASGGGYTTGGQTLASKSISTESINSPARAYFTANAVTWSSSTISAAYAVLYKYTGGTYSAEVMIGCYDFGGTKSSSSGNFTVQPDATDGYIYL